MRFLTKWMQHRCVNITKPQDHTSVAFIKTTAFKLASFRFAHCSGFCSSAFSFACFFKAFSNDLGNPKKKYRITIWANYEKLSKAASPPNNDRRLASELELRWFARPHSSATEEREMMAFISGDDGIQFHASIYNITIWYL